MLIISNFRDYYDYCSGFGIDKTLVYKRSTAEIDKVIDFETYYNGISCSNKYPKLKIYVYFYSLYISGSYKINFAKTIDNVSNDNEQTIKNTKFWFDNKQLNTYWCNYTTTKYSYVRRYGWDHNQKKMLGVYKCPDDITNIMRENNLISILGSREDKTITKDPILRDLHIHKVIDRFDMYNAISTELSNRKEPKDYVIISDKSKIIKHGFNKQSFRKESQL